MYKLLIIFLFILSASCGIIQINSTGAKYLSSAEQDFVKSFEDRGNISSFKQRAPANIYKISTKNVAAIINEKELVWIHKWRPFCSAEGCQIISPFQKKARDNNVQLAFISETADLDDIQKIVSVSKFESPIYFGDYRVYGNGIGKNRKNLQIGLLKNQNVSPLKLADDYLYNNGNLIYQGNDLLDSLEIILSLK